ncbi:MAG TPA: PD-(D/E)XK nuclease family protein [Bacteroidia bacterium]|nr:PD-(D/E)XK nuclease family protein [Bacteroidia bacterium]HNU34345.1 PD-(D/E)XK nuclease family protein [Bacteroidia bacterium]
MATGTIKQAKFILDLVDQYGYRDSPFKDYFLKRINFDYLDVIRASELIDWLLKLNKQKKFPKRRYFDHQKTPIVQELAQYVFCPVSYSIKKTFILENTEDEMPIDDVEPRESYLLKRIKSLKTPIENVLKNPQINDKVKMYYKKIIENQFHDFKPFIESKLIFDGYAFPKEYILYNSEYNIKGRPHLVFEDSSGVRTAVIEKVSYKKTIPDIVWLNNRIQALSYVYLFGKLNCSKASIFYWGWENEGVWDTDRKYRVYHLDKTDFHRELFRNYLNDFLKFIKESKMTFNSSTINPEKCYKCSCRTLCDHKSGLSRGLTLPYIS